MTRFLALVAVLVSCVVVAVPGAQASQRLAGSTVCQLAPTSLVAGPNGTVWYTVVKGSYLSGVNRNLGGSPRPLPSPFHVRVSQPVGAGTSIYRMTPHGKVTAFPISRDPQVPFRVDHITN